MQHLPPLHCEPWPLNQSRTGPGQDDPLPCRIRRRIIETVPFKQSVKRNKNIPKNIIGNFRKFLPEFKQFYEESTYKEVSEKVLGWHRNGFDLNLWHLNDLFGEEEPNSNYANRLVLREMLSSRDLEMIGDRTKVVNILTYLICIHQYMFRLGNGELTGRVQSK